MPVDFMRRFETESRDVLQAMLDQSLDCIKLLSPDGKLEYMNARGLAMMSIKDFSAVAENRWVDLWPAESRGLVSEAVAAAAQGKSSRFESYCPTAAGEPRWWEVSISPVRDKRGRVAHVLATSRDVSALMHRDTALRKRCELAEALAYHRDIVARELRHRIKNIFNVVSAVARLTAAHSHDLNDFLGSFSKRMSRMGIAQDLLAEDREDRAPLDQVLATLLGAPGENPRLYIDSVPQVSLSARAIQTVALVVGELQTNAYKHGAFSSDGGRVRLSCSCAGKELKMEWSEQLASEVETQSLSGGIGFKLIERITASQRRPASIQWEGRVLTVSFSVEID